MSDNQREMQRREKRAKKDRKIKRILWIIIAIALVAIVVMRVCEININSVKDRFTDSDGKLTITDGVIDDNFPYSVDSAQNVIIENCNNKLGILTPSSFTVLNSNNGATEYTFQHGYSNPVLAYSGIYTLVYDQGSSNFRLDTTSGAIYEESVDNTLLCADVSKRGVVAVATTSKTKLCDLCVYDKSLQQRFNTSISTGYVINVALSPSANKLAVATVYSNNATLITNVAVYNVNSGEELGSVDLPSGSLVDLKYSSGNVFVVGDSYAGVIKNESTYEEIFASGDISTVCYDFTAEGELVLVHNDFSNSTSNVVSVIKSSGKIKTQIEVEGNIKDVTTTSKFVNVLTSSKVYGFIINNGTEKGTLDCDDSVKSICRLGSAVFEHKQSIIEKCEADND